MKKKPEQHVTLFGEYWKGIESDFNSCKGVTKYASRLAWNAALDRAIQKLMRDRCEDQCIPELEDMKATPP